MTVFKDDDGKAYLIFGSGWHTHVQIADLTDDYLRPSGVHSKHFRDGPGRRRAVKLPRSSSTGAATT
jgi:beta-xylosidase